MVKNKFVVEVGDTEQLKQCISRLRNVESVFDAYRITPAAERRHDGRGRSLALTVAVTGPTGEIGLPLMAELERRAGGRPRCGGWPGARSTRPRRAGRRSPTAAATSSTAARWRRSSTGADVAVHLAFAIFGDREETRRVNLEGSRNVFEAAIAAGVKRLVYASSVAAYGFHPDNPQPLTEEVPARGSESFYYSAQKAELEATLDELLAGSEVDAYVFRPCIVAGPRATMLIDAVGRAAPASATRCRCCAAGSGAAAGARRSCPTSARRSSSSTTTTSPARWRRRSRGDGRARRLQPRRRGRGRDRRHRPRARLALGPGARARGQPRRRRRPPPRASLARSSSGRRRCAPRS